MSDTDITRYPAHTPLRSFPSFASNFPAVHTPPVGDPDVPAGPRLLAARLAREPVHVNFEGRQDEAEELVFALQQHAAGAAVDTLVLSRTRVTDDALRRMLQVRVALSCGVAALRRVTVLTHPQQR